jgi:hypothetical protein
MIAKDYQPSPPHETNFLIRSALRIARRASFASIRLGTDATGRVRCVLEAVGLAPDDYDSVPLLTGRAENRARGSQFVLFASRHSFAARTISMSVESSGGLVMKKLTPSA